ncbi:hypothetical protein TYRP_020544 [Tyrophagus putrescentiae]|nr:hypothetical protein TYRP_020544 [Tyrophagus putrescentiae]
MKTAEASAEAQVLAAEASASQNQTGRLLFSSDTFFRELRWAVIKRRFRQIQLAKTDACPLSSSEREVLSECPFPAHLLRQLFQWMPLRGALHLGLTCKALFTLYRRSLATDRRSLVLANGYYEFKDTGSSPFISEWVDDLRTVLWRYSTATKRRTVKLPHDKMSTLRTCHARPAASTLTRHQRLTLTTLGHCERPPTRAPLARPESVDVHSAQVLSDLAALGYFGLIESVKQRLSLVSLGSPKTPAYSDFARFACEALVGGRFW